MDPAAEPVTTPGDGAPARRPALDRKQRTAGLLGLASIVAGVAVLGLTAQMVGLALGPRLAWGIYGAGLVVIGAWVIDRTLAPRLG